MPWASAEVPSLGLGILRQAVTDQFPAVEVDVLYANLDYIDWIQDRVHLGLEDYSFYAIDSYFLGCGDWVFTSALYDDPEWHSKEFSDAMASYLNPAEIERCKRLHRLAPDYIEWLAERIVAAGPDVVGFGVTFQQNTAALAAAKYVKRLAPDIVTVLGGANCDDTQGAAVHRNFSFVDLVVRGEADATFPQVVGALLGDQDFNGLAGVCWRSADGDSVANEMSDRPLAPGQIVSPNYDGYFERFATSMASGWLEPKLVLEGARGCWWGEKHHCTFCGLNGSTMQFRSKTPAAFFTEIVTLAERHRTLDVIVVDNILDMTYLKSLIPMLADVGYEFRFLFEIKANLRREQLRDLRRAGAVHVQPGIENFNSRVLKLMNKGTTGCLNIRILRDAQTVGLMPAWNYLYGFPGETEGDYSAILDQFPALFHLAPPSPQASRIAIERFSPYFNRPELGFANLRPAAQYYMNYNIAEPELFDLAYIFDAPQRGVSDEVGGAINAAVRQWLDCHRRSRFTYCDLSDRVVLVNTRPHFDWRTLCIDDPVQLAAFRLLDQPVSIRSLQRSVASRPELPAVTADYIAELMRHWRELGIVFEDSGQFIQVASEAANQELLRLRSTSFALAGTLAAAPA
jgi:ribosomal peptide maturation radical SAM protein 1